MTIYNYLFFYSYTIIVAAFYAETPSPRLIFVYLNCEGSILEVARYNVNHDVA